MRWLVVLAIMTLVACGCSGMQPVGTTWMTPASLPNPMFVPTNDPQAVWETTVDVVDDYFRVEHEEPVRVIGATITEGRLETFPEPGATLFEPWLADSVGLYERTESTLQSIRRRAQVRVTPAQGGYWVDVAVFKELEDAVQPYMSTAGAATMSYDGSLVRVVNPIGEQEVNRGWIPYGRDDKLEQRILGHVQDRFAGYGFPFRIGAKPPAAPAPQTPVAR
jgi:hypothetical protein